MQEQENKTIYLKNYSKATHLQQKKKQKSRYHCMMSGNRLEGFCDVLIYDTIQQQAELFCMCFTKTDVTKHHYLNADAVMAWKYKNPAVRITYLQAMTLLGDAVRQNYKFQKEPAWSHGLASVHVERIWQKDYYDYTRGSLLWLLQGLDLMAFITVYLNAIGNKDAMLLYDMTAESKKQKISRELYAYNWNHALEDIRILSFDIDYIEPRSEEKQYNIYITVYGCYQENDLLSIDLCLKLVSENRFFYLLREQVLEANHILPS